LLVNDVCVRLFFWAAFSAAIFGPLVSMAQPPGPDAVRVAAGYQHTLLVKPDGTVWAFGDNGSGQLGDNS
jgi:hypothetical protein